MATNAQITANRQNAKKSTGPKSPRGKAAVAQNALKHGLTTTRDVVITETREDFDLHRDALIQDLNPQTPTESILAARIISLSWRLRRAVNIQDQAIDGIQDKIMNGESSYQRREEKDLDPALALGRIVYNDFKEYRAFERLLIYEKRIENSLYKTMKELKTLKNARKTDRIDQNYPKPNRLTPGPAPGQTPLQKSSIEHRASRIRPPRKPPPAKFSLRFARSRRGPPENKVRHPTSHIERSEIPMYIGIRNMKNKPNCKCPKTNANPAPTRAYNQKMPGRHNQKQTQSSPISATRERNIERSRRSPGGEIPNSLRESIENPPRHKTITRRY